jgi:hypothetical protein
MSRTIEADAFLETAFRETGLEDMGIAGWRANLDVLVDSLNREAALSETGKQLVWQWVLRRLRNRLAVVEYRKRHPELASEKVERPWFVCGMMRTGTTILYELLHLDPRARCLMKWESMACVPPPRKEAWDSDPRLIRARSEVEEVFARTPDAKAAHYEAPDGPTECVELLTQHFAAQDWSWWRVPAYLDHFSRCDMRGAFAYHRECLELLQSDAPGRWTLKAPAHLLSLPALFAVYPDARVIVTHRDPTKCVASMAHMSCQYRPEILSDRWKRAELARYYGAMWLEHLAVMVERMIDARPGLPEGAVYDLHYADFARDPVAAVRDVYRAFDEPFEAELEHSMREHLRTNPGDRFGARRFAMEEFGLSDAAIRRRFEHYESHFGVARGV